MQRRAEPRDDAEEENELTELERVSCSRLAYSLTALTGTREIDGRVRQCSAKSRPKLSKCLASLGTSCRVIKMTSWQKTAHAPQMGRVAHHWIRLSETWKHQETAGAAGVSGRSSHKDLHLVREYNPLSSFGVMACTGCPCRSMRTKLKQQVAPSECHLEDLLRMIGQV